MNFQIANIRKEYQLKTLSENEVDKNAIAQFSIWWNEAIKSELDEVNALTLATASAKGIPSARIVLLKDFNENGFTFFTNYQSKKANDIAENPFACLVIFWAALQRQIRIEGVISKVDTNISDEYFNSRPVASQIGAWASPQSKIIKSREDIEENEKKIALQFENTNIKRPENWGGYIVKPTSIEFWQGRPSRLHDRILYTIIDKNSWKIERLAP